MGAPAPTLALSGVSKSFGSTRALSGVSLELLPGEVHVIAGENGAGKSTLIKILSGVYQDYEGDVVLDGARVRFSSPRDAKDAGIATIHQELSLVGNLSAVDNLLLVEGGSGFAPIARRGARERTRALLDAVELSLDPDAPVETHDFAERQLLEIARALAQKARIFVMDEPTSALAEAEAERLFSRIERLVGEGASVVYISHRMEEMYRLAGRISVLRDGKCVLTRPASELSRDELVKAMLGRSEQVGPTASARERPGAPLLAVRELTRRAGPPRDVSFELRPGEILGVAGLRGAGAGGLLHALFGSGGPVDADVLLDGVRYRPSTPRAALRRGIALLAGDRHSSVLASLSVLENSTLSSLERYARAGVVERRRERADVEREGARISLRAPSVDAEARTLSGGNQQKVALLRCLLAKPKLLLLDDPTRGVDLGAKAEIHTVLRSLAQTGMSMLFHATELDELFAVSDRVLVLHAGRLVATLEGGELTRERLLRAMLGVAA